MRTVIEIKKEHLKAAWPTTAAKLLLVILLLHNIIQKEERYIYYIQEEISIYIYILRGDRYSYVSLHYVYLYI